MSSSSASNAALVATEQKTLQKSSIKRPIPGPHQVLVKIAYTAQNPTDVQSLDANAGGVGAVYGCDFVGEVVSTGEKVTRVAKGDKVAGLIWGGEEKGLGAFAQFTLADEKICFKVPPSISDAAAATVPLAACTAWLALLSDDCLNMELGRSDSILIWGGSSSVGQYAIQLASLAGFEVITTCSPRNFDLVRKLGAKHVFDYRQNDVVENIRTVSPDLRYVFDTIGSENSSVTAARTLIDGGGLCTVRPGKAHTERVPNHVKVTDVLVWTAFLKDHSYAEFKWPASQDDHRLGAEIFEKLPFWLENGQIKPNDVVLLKGFDSVAKGFDMHRQGSLSAQKIVYDFREE